MLSLSAISTSLISQTTLNTVCLSSIWRNVRQIEDRHSQCIPILKLMYNVYSFLNNLWIAGHALTNT